jgi:hypothetical protein
VSHQSIRQAARRRALDVQSRQRRERAERGKRLEALAVQVLTAVGERDAAVADTESRAGQALAMMTEAEGLSLREAVQWCGEEIGLSEAKRLRRIGDQDHQAGEPEPGYSEGAEATA